MKNSADNSITLSVHKFFLSFFLSFFSLFTQFTKNQMDQLYPCDLWWVCVEVEAKSLDDEESSQVKEGQRVEEKKNLKLFTLKMIHSKFNNKKKDRDTHDFCYNWKLFSVEWFSLVIFLYIYFNRFMDSG